MWVRKEEKISRYKVHVLPSDEDGIEFFYLTYGGLSCNRHLLQDTVVKPHCHNLVQMCRKAITDRSRCIALHHVVLQHIRNVANRSVMSLLKGRNAIKQC